MVKESYYITMLDCKHVLLCETGIEIVVKRLQQNGDVNIDYKIGDIDNGF